MAKITLEQRGTRMPRFLVERAYGQAEEEAMQNIGERMKRVTDEEFPDVAWEHSHVVSDESGIKTFCVYEAPTEEQLRQHGDMVGEHTILRVYEIAGDVTPGDFTAD
jgi:hypothetical protein